MRAQSLICAVVLSAVVLVIALARLGPAGATEAPTEAQAESVAPACPGCKACQCETCWCVTPRPVEGLRPWFPGKVLLRTIAYPFRKQAPKRPVAPRLWPRCYEVTR